MILFFVSLSRGEREILLFVIQQEGMTNRNICISAAGGEILIFVYQQEGVNY